MQFLSKLWSAHGSFGYTPGEVLPYSPPRAGVPWTLRGGSKKDDASAVTIFEVDTKKAPAGTDALAKAAVRRTKTARHPGLLTFVDSAELGGGAVVCLVTEPVTPLQEVLHDLATFPMAVSWGIFQIAKALQFLNNDCKLVHGNVGIETVFVTRGGDWKLGGMEFATEFDAIERSALRAAGGPPGGVKPPECEKGLWEQIPKSPLWAIDSFLLGRLIESVFNKLSLEIPRELQVAQQRLVYADPNRRPAALQIIESPYFANPYAEALDFLENIAIKDPTDKDSFFGKKLPPLLDEFPPAVCKYKILPALIEAIEFGHCTAPAKVIGPLLRLGKSLTQEEFSQKVTPQIVKWFASPDKSLRMSLLENIETYVEYISQSIMNDQIFPNICNGFVDPMAQIRDLTVRSMIPLVPKSLFAPLPAAEANAVPNAGACGQREQKRLRLGRHDAPGNTDEAVGCRGLRLQDMPDAEVLHVLSFLAQAELCTVALVCRRLRVLVDACDQWRRAVVRSSSLLPQKLSLPRFSRVDELACVGPDSVPSRRLPGRISRSLRRLDVCFTDHASLSPLCSSRLPQLASLTLTGAAVGDASLAKIAQNCCELRHLSLFNACSARRGLAAASETLTDAGLRAVLAGCSRLESLQVGGNARLAPARLSDAFLECPLPPSLACVSVERVRVSDEAAASLGRCPGLRCLSALHTALTASGALALAVALPLLEHLHVFSASACPLAVVRSVGRALRSPRSLCFNLGDDAQMSVDDVVELVEALPRSVRMLGAFAERLAEAARRPQVVARGLRLVFITGGPEATNTPLPWLRDCFGIAPPSLPNSVLFTPQGVLGERNINTQVLKHFAKLQIDPEPCIRTNTTVCIGKLAPWFTEATRSKVLLPAFSRALQDTFPPARTAAVVAFSVTLQYYTPEALAKSVIPAVSPCMIDPEKTVREEALRCVRASLDAVDKWQSGHADDVSPSGQPQADQNSGAAKAMAVAGSAMEQGWSVLQNISRKLVGDDKKPDSATAAASASASSASPSPASGRSAPQPPQPSQTSQSSSRPLALGSSQPPKPMVLQPQVLQPQVLAPTAAALTPTPPAQSPTSSGWGEGWDDPFEPTSLPEHAQQQQQPSAAPSLIPPMRAAAPLASKPPAPLAAGLGAKPPAASSSLAPKPLTVVSAPSIAAPPKAAGRPPTATSSTSSSLLAGSSASPWSLDNLATSIPASAKSPPKPAQEAGGWGWDDEQQGSMAKGGLLPTAADDDDDEWASFTSERSSKLDQKLMTQRQRK
eukprot:m51a1_g7686 hypothetical protein (1273) ;mRNA; r:30894-36078